MVASSHTVSPESLKSTLGADLAAAGSSGDQSSRKYITGAGAISIAFLLELLKLNTEMKNEMAEFTANATETQSKVISNQSNAQKSLYDNQAAEMVLQASTAVVGAITSGINLGAAYAGGAKEQQQEAESMSEQLKSYNNLTTDTDTLYMGEESGNGQFSERYSEGQKEEIAAIREKLMTNGITSSKEFSSNDLETATIKHNGTDYSVKDVISTSTPEERTKIAEGFSKRRDSANEAFRHSYQAWQQRNQNITMANQVVKSGSDAATSFLQSNVKKSEGAASAASQEAQGASTILADAKRTTDDARSKGQQDGTQALQTIREIVASQVRG